MMNVAQIGVGYWGPNLLRNLVAHKECTVKRVADIALERQEYVNSLYPAVHVTKDVQVIMDDPSIQAIVIATPAKTHFELVLQALQSGKHVLVEKPMAMTIAEVEQIEALAQQSNLIAMVGHTFLYNSAVRYLKKLIDSGELGELRYIYSQRLNLGRIRSDVDVLWNLAPHDVSIIHYLLDDPSPVTVVKNGMDYVQQGIADVVFLHIQYPQKVMAHIHVSWLDPHKVRRMIVVGSKKMVVYDDVGDNKIAIYDKGIDPVAVLGDNMDFDELNFGKFTYRSGDVLWPKIDFQEPLKVEIAHFIDCIQDGTPCLSGPEHAKHVLEVLSA